VKQQGKIIVKIKLQRLRNSLANKIVSAELDYPFIESRVKSLSMRGTPSKFIHPSVKTRSNVKSQITVREVQGSSGKPLKGHTDFILLHRKSPAR
jgi:hypothetical protein